MSEETETGFIDEEAAEEETEDLMEAMEDDAGNQRHNNGPGFRLGILIGLIAGALAATLFAPPTGEETSAGAADQGVASPDDHRFAGEDIDFETPIARMRSMIEHLRARVQEASREAELASKEAQELAQARYAELTHQDNTEA